MTGTIQALRAHDDGEQAADLLKTAFFLLVEGMQTVTETDCRYLIAKAIDVFGVSTWGGEHWQRISGAAPSDFVEAHDHPLFLRLDIAGESSPFQSALAMLQLAILMAPTYALADSLYAPVEALYDAFGIPNPADRQAHPEHYPTVAPSVLRQLEMHFDFPERSDTPEEGAA